MESLWLLIPVSALIVLMIIAIFGWAIHRGQFEELDGEAERILQDEAQPGVLPARPPGQALDADQAARAPRAEQY